MTIATHGVYYNLFDKDAALFVKPINKCYDKDGTQCVFDGTEKECRRYVIENQHKHDTPSLKRILPYVPARRASTIGFDTFDPQDPMRMGRAVAR